VLALRSSARTALRLGTHQGGARTLLGAGLCDQGLARRRLGGSDLSGGGAAGGSAARVRVEVLGKLALSERRCCARRLGRRGRDVRRRRAQAVEVTQNL
jgi:hypothetical protein